MTDTKKNACYVNIIIVDGRFIQYSTPTLHITSNKSLSKQPYRFSSDMVTETLKYNYIFCPLNQS